MELINWIQFIPIRLMVYLGALLGLLLGLLNADELVPVQGDESVHRTPVSGRLLKLLADLSKSSKVEDADFDPF
jgi:hypothetical protein